MSGGSFNYLCYARFPDVCYRTNDMEDMELYLIKIGYTDIAKDVRRLIEYCKSAENRIGVLFDQLEDVFHSVEWKVSGDIGEETLIERLEKYRGEKQDDSRENKKT